MFIQSFVIVSIAIPNYISIHFISIKSILRLRYIFICFMVSLFILSFLISNPNQKSSQTGQSQRVKYNLDLKYGSVSVNNFKQYLIIYLQHLRTIKSPNWYFCFCNFCSITISILFQLNPINWWRFRFIENVYVFFVGFHSIGFSVSLFFFS